MAPIVAWSVCFHLCLSIKQAQCSHSHSYLCSPCSFSLFILGLLEHCVWIQKPDTIFARVHRTHVSVCVCRVDVRIPWRRCVLIESLSKCDSLEKRERQTKLVRERDKQRRLMENHRHWQTVSE